MLPRSLLWALPLALAACSGGPPRSTPPQTSEVRRATLAPAEQLVGKMIAALEAEDAAAWQKLLSAPMRERFSKDLAALHDHMLGWRRDLMPLADQLRRAELAIDATGSEPVVTYAVDGRDAIALASVVDEGGALHLDEQ